MPVLPRGLLCRLRSQRHAASQSTSTATMAAATPNGSSAPHPPPSRRIASTDDPCIVSTKRLVSSVPGTLSLAQGIVYWQPPPQALQRASAAVLDPANSGYGPDEGLPSLRAALREKLARDNNLAGYDVMVTGGANQAFTNVVLTLTDAEDGVVLFTPFYFNHHMAIQMTGGGDRIVYGPCNKKSFHPNLDWLERELATNTTIKMVVLINPNNPAGVLLSRAELDRAAALCSAAGVWLIVDCTYEDFVFLPEIPHYCPSGAHVLHIFSFSKAYGLMGWRQGYIAYPEASELASQLLKVQDTVPICANLVGQNAALGALEAGREWVAERVAGLAANRAAVASALSPLGDGVAGGEGAIYFWAQLPAGCDDDKRVVEWLVKKHKVCVIPGSSCGCPGYVRVAFANLEEEMCQEAAGRLKAGLQELVVKGMEAVQADIAAFSFQ